MKALSSTLAQEYLNRAKRAASVGPVVRPKTDSRTADKFVARAQPDLWKELVIIGQYQGRSLNSECVAAILDALNGHTRSYALLSILMEKLGDHAQEILDGIAVFELNYKHRECKKFVIRFPESVRETVRKGVSQSSTYSSMNSWFSEALAKWVNIQRQQYALLSAAMAMDLPLIGADE